ncbi:MAG: hypothetical protein ACK4JY_07235 [Brevundimonas sp.]|uniref:hypothetical protein n=1 Tax=Brevundimonas sp. TaxID=1871086 RepID=UPI00391BCE0D
MTDKPEPDTSIGDVFQEQSAPHRRWRVTGRGLVFQLECVEEPHLLRFLSSASLTDPFRYRPADLLL